MGERNRGSVVGEHLSQMQKLSVCDQDFDRSSEVAFQAWLRVKAKQRREEQRRKKSDTAEAGQVREKRTFLQIAVLFTIIAMYSIHSFSGSCITDMERTCSALFTFNF